jgi:hypothetical protein
VKKRVSGVGDAMLQFVQAVCLILILKELKKETGGAKGKG